MSISLFDTTGFPPRWHCGNWSDLHGWIHIISDVAIFGAYSAIPVSIAYYALRKRREVMSQRLYWLFAIFILSCGFTHLIEATIFWHPWYRLSALVKVITAIASWTTVFVLLKDLPTALSLPGIARLNQQLLKEIEERKQIQIEREHLLESEKAARKEAESANRMKDEFMAILSHELRTPLNAIIGWTHLLQSDTGVSGELPEGLEIIQRNARQQAQLIEELLDLSRITSGKIHLQNQPLKLEEVVGAAVEVVLPTAQQKGVELLCDIRTEPALMLGDFSRLQQVVTNLLVNAVKFTPSGGQIQVSLDHYTDQTGFVVQVKDTGTGIMPDFLPHIFERFRQADSSVTRKQGGLGIGLAIVKSLTEMHGGTVEVQSDGEGKGACFTIKLPLRLAEDHEASSTGFPSRPDTNLIDFGGLSVLAIDNENDSLQVVRILLERHGATVDATVSANDALRLCESRTYSIVISDIAMPEMDGYTFIRNLRRKEAENGSRAIAIALTAFAREEDRARAREAGFDHVLAKPFSPRALLECLEDARQSLAKPIRD